MQRDALASLGRTLRRSARFPSGGFAASPHRDERALAGAFTPRGSAARPPLTIVAGHTGQRPYNMATHPIAPRRLPKSAAFYPQGLQMMVDSGACARRGPRSRGPGSLVPSVPPGTPRVLPRVPVPRVLPRFALRLAAARWCCMTPGALLHACRLAPLLPQGSAAFHTGGRGGLRSPRPAGGAFTPGATSPAW